MPMSLTRMEIGRSERVQGWRRKTGKLLTSRIVFITEQSHITSSARGLSPQAVNTNDGHPQITQIET